MALIICPECKKDISLKASNCPNCGYKPSVKERERLKSKTYLVYRFGMKWLIIFLFIIGVGMIGYSTYLFSHLIPSKDLEIMSREKYLDDMQNNYNLYEAKDTKGYIANSTLHILYNIPAPNSRYQNLHNRYESISALELLNFKYDMITIFTPTDSLKYITIDSTLTLDKKIHQLDTIFTRRMDIVRNRMNDRRTEINDIIDWRIKNTRRATIIQIIGLLLNQVGIILKLTFKIAG